MHFAEPGCYTRLMNAESNPKILVLAVISFCCAPGSTVTSSGAGSEPSTTFESSDSGTTGDTTESTVSESTTLESETAGDTAETTVGDDCPACASCSEQELCVTRCETFLYEGCYTECVPEIPFETYLDACEFEEYLCGEEMVITSFGKGGLVCGDILCSPGCQICQSCSWAECNLGSESCGEKKCCPIDAHGLSPYDWLICLPTSGDLPVGSPCTNHIDSDECEDNAVCIYGTCREPCSEQFTCSNGSSCVYDQNWIPFCLPD